MANFSELSGLKQWGAVLAGGAIVTAALFFTVFKTQSEKNTTAQHALEDKVRENKELESYRPKLQLEIEARIVPNEKQLDGFITMLDGEAQKSGVWLRRYTAKPTASKEYYTEVPFDLELDGPYYGVPQVFDPVGKLERIVNVSGLLVSTTKTPSAAKAKHTYQYAPNESVVATCTATTFFSHDSTPAAAGAGAKPGTTPAAVSR